MEDSGLIIKKVRFSGLRELSSGQEYLLQEIIPLSPARAHSQSLNPAAEKDDVVLVMVLDEKSNQLLGFMGAFPCRTTVERAGRLAWISNWYVNEKARGRGIAQLLLRNMKDSWQGRIAIPDLTQPTLSIIRKDGVWHIMERPGILLNLRPGLVKRLEREVYTANKGKKLLGILRLPGLARLTDKTWEIFLFPVKYFWKSLPEPVVLEALSEQDREFIRAHSVQNIYLPSPEDLDMPAWLVFPSDENLYLTGKYPFSLFAKCFKTFWLRWEIKGKTETMAMVSIRDGVLKTPYVYSLPETSVSPSDLIFAFALKRKDIHTIMSSAPGIAAGLIGKKVWFPGKRKYTRYSAISVEFMEHFPSGLIFQDGDGDSRFT